MISGPPNPPLNDSQNDHQIDPQTDPIWDPKMTTKSTPKLGPKLHANQKCSKHPKCVDSHVPTHHFGPNQHFLVRHMRFRAQEDPRTDPIWDPKTTKFGTTKWPPNRLQNRPKFGTQKWHADVNKYVKKSTLEFLVIYLQKLKKKHKKKIASAPYWGPPLYRVSKYPSRGRQKCRWKSRTLFHTTPPGGMRAASRTCSRNSL